MTVSLLAISAVAHAGYNANITGTVTAIMTYRSGQLLFVLNDQPSSDGSCIPTYFELLPTDAANQAAFNAMYARLVEAYALGEQVNIGYDDPGTSCSPYGYIPVYRIG